jgi:hypothetical protein
MSAKRTIVTSFVVDLGILLAEALEGGSDLVASGSRHLHHCEGVLTRGFGGVS